MVSKPHTWLAFDFSNLNKLQEATKLVAMNGRGKGSPNWDIRWGWRSEIKQFSVGSWKVEAKIWRTFTSADGGIAQLSALSISCLTIGPKARLAGQASQ